MRKKKGYPSRGLSLPAVEHAPKPFVMVPGPKVDMKEYYAWLKDKLDAGTIRKIREISSREGFQAYCRGMGIRFQFHPTE